MPILPTYALLHFLRDQMDMCLIVSSLCISYFTSGHNLLQMSMCHEPIQLDHTSEILPLGLSVIFAHPNYGLESCARGHAIKSCEFASRDPMTHVQPELRAMDKLVDCTKPLERAKRWQCPKHMVFQQHCTLVMRPQYMLCNVLKARPFFI